MNLLVTPRELANLPDAMVFDCRFALTDKEIGHQQYRQGHIPGAQYADLEKHLSAPPGDGGRHPLPSHVAFLMQVREWGIRNDSPVVCYDANNGAFAGRLWWLLRWLGHADVAVLDGGMDAWLAAGLPTEQVVRSFPASNFEPGPTLTRTAEVQELLSGNRTLIDARDEKRFRGEEEPIDPVAGHIPGALCAPFAGNLVDGKFKSPEDLATRFSGLGVSEKSDIVCYCGSGVTATHNILALLLAGYDEPALYPGSWSGWITDPARPVETS